MDRRFEPGAAERAWTAEITYVSTREGWLTLTAVEDMHTGRIIGWPIGEPNDSRLVVDVLGMAIRR